MPGALHPLRFEGPERRAAGKAGRHHERMRRDAIHDYGHALRRFVHSDHHVGACGGCGKKYEDCGKGGRHSHDRPHGGTVQTGFQTQLKHVKSARKNTVKRCGPMRLFLFTLVFVAALGGPGWACR
jgi:hypothetical protein